jgi:hypothetical protein
MFSRIIVTVALAAATTLSDFGPAAIAMAAETGTQPSPVRADGDADAASRLMIVNGHTGRVIYDDGYDDLFCVTRRIVIGYDDYDRPIFRRTLRCR